MCRSPKLKLYFEHRQVSCFYISSITQDMYNHLFIDKFRFPQQQQHVSNRSIDSMCIELVVSFHISKNMKKVLWAIMYIRMALT